MHHPFRSTFSALAMVLLTAGSAFGSEAVATDSEQEARKARILANLLVQFPQLEELGAVMGTLGPSAYAGLDEGHFVVRGQQQPFFVSNDDTKLYLLQSPPFDVSRTSEQLAEERAARARAEAQQTSERAQLLEEAIKSVPLRGNPEASIAIVEFSSFQCPYCARGSKTIDQVLEKYGSEVKVAFMHFPLDFQPWSKPAAIAASCAAAQSDEAFWALHHFYFEHQQAITPANVMDKSREQLGALAGVDMAKWASCASDPQSAEHQAAAKAVEESLALGGRLGVSGTPAFFVNGQFLNGAQPLPAFESAIAAAKAMQ